MSDKKDYTIVGHKGDESFDSGILMSVPYNPAKIIRMGSGSSCRFPIKEDKLKDITDKEIYVIAVLEMLENRLWIEGNKTSIMGKETAMRSCTQGKTIEEVISEVNGDIEFTQTNANWKDGRHEGDCTNVAQTCMRCLCECRLSTARKFMNWFNTGDYQNY